MTQTATIEAAAPQSGDGAETLDGFPLSPQQRRCWRVLKAGDGGLRAWSVVRFEGELDRAALAGALGDLVARHEILRTRFSRLPGMTLPVQVIEPAAYPGWREHAVASAADLEPFLAALLDGHGTGGAEAPLLLLELVAVGREPLAALLVSLSPLLVDGTSLSCLVSELGELYAARRAGVAPPASAAMQYADFAQWQNDGLASEDGAEGRELWRSCPLAGDGRELPFAPPDELALGSGFCAIPRASSWGGRASRLAAEMEVPEEAVLLAAWQTLLARTAGGTLPLVWTALDGRGYDELESAVGLYHRFAPVVTGIDEREGFRELVARLGQRLEEMVLWQEYLAWDVADAAPGEEPLELGWGFELCALPAVRTVDGVRIRVEQQDGTGERFQVRFLGLRGEDGLRGGLWFDRARLAAPAVARLAQGFAALLETALADPTRPLGSLDLLGPDERLEVFESWNRRPVSATLPAVAGVDERVFASLDARADAVAYDFAGCVLTQGALDRRAGAIAARLMALGIVREARVGICLRRGPEMAAAFLGVLRAGAAGVALSPDHPPRRLERLLADVRPALVLAEEATVAALPPTAVHLLVSEIGAVPAEAKVQIDGGQLAYVVYTSGTSGRPKGIETAHRGVVSYLSHLNQTLDLGPGDAVLQLPDLIYDASVRDLLTPLLGGARVVLVSEAQLRDPAALLAVIRRQRVTALLSVVPTVLRALLAAARGSGERWETVHTVLVSGEKLRPEDVRGARRIFRDGTRVLNLYGPTECTMTSTLCEVPALGVEEAGTVAIGRPIANAALYVVDEKLRPVLPGVPGEGVIGGVGLARAYLGQPARTAASFVPDPFAGEPGARLFRTGDLVFHDPQGQLEIVGRRDQQIKLRGVRVEPGEIEAELRRQSGVREAAVMARRDPETEALSLLAWVVPEDPLAAIPEEQRYHLPNGLPIRHLNRYETDFFYQQIFEDRVDVKSGLELPPGAVVFDVGANIGLFSLYAHLAQDGVRLFAFEPIPETCAVLRSNLELYGADAHVECCGLSNRNGSTRFAYYPLSSCQSGYYPDESQERYMLEAIIARQSSDPAAFSVGREYFAGLVDQRMQRRMLDCPLKTVSTVIAEQGLERIDLLKIDVEKSELDVLEGVSEADWPKIQQVSIEAHDLEGRLAKIVGLLEARGYRVVVEQEDALLDETCLFNVYATRKAAGEVRLPLEPRLPRRLLEGRVSAESLRQALAAVLPEALVPAAFVLLDEMPRTAGGKIDRQALPAPGSGDADTDGLGIALTRDAATPTEEIIAGILATLLERESVGLDDDFFVIGGHSLLGTQAVLRINHAFEIEVPLQRLFENPSVRTLATVVDEARRRRAGRAVPPLVPAPARDRLPLSFAQQRLWFLDQLKPGNPWHNLPGAMRLHGRLEVPILRRTLNALVARHETLRTRFPTARGGVPYQVVEPAAPMPLPLVDLAGLPEAVRAPEVERLLRAAAHHSFDLARGPLFRGLLLREGEAQHVAHFNLHHIIGDAWSNSILVREIAALFNAFTRGAPSPLPELPIQYADYAHWQRQWLDGEVLDQLVASWKETLEGAPPVIDLPRDRPRGTAWRGGVHNLELSADLVGRIEELGRRHQTSLFMTLLAALDVTLHSLSGALDLVVGADVAHRSRIETEPLIGFFINQIVLRLDLGGDPTFAELLGRVRRVALAAYERQDLPFDKLVEAVNPERDANYAPIFQVKLVVQNTPKATLSLSRGLEVTLLPAESRPASEDLLINAVQSEDGLTLRFKYNAALFVAATIERLAERLRLALERGGAEPQLRLSELAQALRDGDRDRRSQEAEQRGAALGSKLQSVRRRSARR